MQIVMKKLHVILALVFGLILLTSCDPQTPIDQEAPEIPPSQLFSMPTTALSTMEPDTATPGTGVTYKNWAFSAINLVVWHTAIVLHVSLPTAAFNHALQQNPVFIGNGTFEWSYVYNAPPALGGNSYDVVLTAQYVSGNQKVQWSMKVAEAGTNVFYEWYTGLTDVDWAEATFTVNRNPANPEAYLRIDYERTSPAGDFSIRYTSISPNDPGVGGYLEYRETSQGTFDRAFDVVGGANKPGEFVEIQWDSQNEDGRVKSPGFFNDSNWHCWDENQIDAGC